MIKLCIVDTRSANFNSVVQAFKRLDIEPVITRDLATLHAADKIVLPGVGTAGAVMDGIGQGEVRDFITSTTKPLLGICLGMQVLAERSFEVGTQSSSDHINTLGITNGDIHMLKAGELPLPHMGWNTVKHTDHPLFKDIPQDSYFYFVHSYCLDVGSDTIASCLYGQDFTAAVAHNNFMGVQFHPEKSGAIGAKLLQNFLDL